MHKSRLGTIVIDCRTDDLDSAARFWSAALGRRAEALADPGASSYRELEGPPDEIKVLVQAVDQLGLFAAHNPVVEELAEMNPDSMTPLEALTALSRLVARARRG